MQYQVGRITGINHEERVDQFGNAIFRGSKAHHVSFRDEAEKGTHVADFIIVPSFKKYNAQVEDDELSSCQCALL